MGLPFGLSMPGSGFNFEDIYKIQNTGHDWFRQLPYGFFFANRNCKAIGGSDSLYAWLPIAPSNLTITTQFATNIITTLYGVVEEHSEIRYYDITIQGTTGFSPRYPAPNANVDQKALRGRRHFIENPFFAKLNSTGFAQQTLGTITTAAETVMDAFGNENTTGIPDTLKGTDVACQGPSTGYLAFHNLYRLLQLYKRDASGQPDSKGFSQADTARTIHPLQFLNNKDGNKYDVVPISFSMIRTAESPMLYHYSIVMRGYNLRNVDAKTPGIDKLSSLGLGGGASLFNQVSSAASTITSGVSGVMGALGGLGG